MKIALISDIHYGAPATESRRGDWGDYLLRRAVRTINTIVRPDLTICLGDLLENGMAPDASRRLVELRAILDKLESRWLVLPGHHDGDLERFFQYLPRPEPCVEIAGVRFLAFLDSPEPEFNAHRSATDIQRLRDARRDGYTGPVVAWQQVPLFAPGACASPYHFINAVEILAAMEGARVSVALCGHYHPGVDHVQGGALRTVIAPALCERPYVFLEIDLQDAQVSVRRHQLAPPAGLVDMHVHTPLAYCNQNMDFARAIEAAQVLGLAGIVFAEHSGHLYAAVRGRPTPAGLVHPADSGAVTPDERLRQYLAALRQYGRTGFVYAGLECDIEPDGSLLAEDRDLPRFEIRLGAVHGLPETNRPRPPEKDIRVCYAQFMRCVEGALAGGQIQILAHPFRVFWRWRRHVPQDLFAPVADLLRRHRAAVELNFHSDAPAPEFYRLCLAQGVKIALGSDAHHLDEVGSFAPHLAFLEQCGVNRGDWPQVLFAAPRRRT